MPPVCCQTQQRRVAGMHRKGPMEVIEGPAGRTTLAKLAEEAGVSIGTVSKVLNGRSDVAANWAGGVAATRHLLELGHERIAVISGRADMMCSLARVDGFRSAMRTAGVPVREDWVHFGDFQVSGGRLGAERLLASPD